MESKPIRRYTVDIKDQVADGLIDSADLVSYLQGLMKVRNSRVIAQREIEFVNNGNSVEIASAHGNIEKKNMKLYIKRYLRSKALREFIKVSGDYADGFTLKYINKIDEAAK